MTRIACPTCGQPAAYVNGQILCKVCPDKASSPAAAARPTPARQNSPPPRLRAVAPAQTPARPVVAQQAPAPPEPVVSSSTPSRSLPTRMTVVHDQMFSAGFRFGLGFFLAWFVFSMLFMMLFWILVGIGLTVPYVTR